MFISVYSCKSFQSYCKKQLFALFLEDQELWYNYCRPISIFQLQLEHKDRRLQWTRDHVTFSKEFWILVFFRTRPKFVCCRIVTEYVRERIQQKVLSLSMPVPSHSVHSKTKLSWFSRKLTRLTDMWIFKSYLHGSWSTKGI